MLFSTPTPYDDEKHEQELTKRRVCSSAAACLILCPFDCFFMRLPCLPRSQKPLYAHLPYDDSIRLLRLHPGKPKQEISCTLELMRLDPHTLPSYEALSYVWRLQSDENAEKTIKCNGQIKDKVGTNLHDALQHLRRSRHSRLIWVDALCINQSDDREKGHQVRKMHQIYNLATRVIVWLGTDKNGYAKAAFDCLKSIGGDTKMAWDEKSQERKKKGSKAERIEKVENERVPSYDNPVWGKVMTFFCNAWFFRIWVVQEIALARSAIVQWGQCHIPWTVVGNALEVIRSEPKVLMVIESRSLQNAYAMWHLFKMQQTSRKKTHLFLHLLDVARSFDVTDERDKVYGLLGFLARNANPRTGVFIKPNYALTVGEVYTKVSRKVLRKDRNLDVLSFVLHGKDDLDKKTDRPSWVPDWNCKDVVYPFMSFYLNSQHKFGASRPMDLHFGGGKRFLQVKGICVDTIAEIGEDVKFEHRISSDSILKELMEWYLIRGGKADVLSMTLTAGRKADSRLVGDKIQHLANFVALLEDLDIDIAHFWPDRANYLSELRIKLGNAATAREAFWRYSCYRAPFITEQGKLGLGPRATRAGDTVAVLWGGQIPFIVREFDKKSWCKFVGECSVASLFEEEHIVDKWAKSFCQEEKFFEIR